MSYFKEENISLDLRSLSTKFRESWIDFDFDGVKISVKALAKKDLKFLYHELDEAFTIACKMGYLQSIKFILTSKDLDHHAFIHAKNGEALELACENGCLDVVKYLLTSRELNQNAYLSASAFTDACSMDQVEVIKYLFENHYGKDELNINAIYSGFIQTCRYGSLKSLKYIWENTELKDSEELSTNLSTIFGLAHIGNHLDIVQYMIFNLDIEKDEIVKGYLKSNPNEKVNQWFELRDLNSDLSDNLSTTDNNVRKIKI